MPVGKPPMRECPKCKCIFHARILVCPGCGHIFPTPEASAKHGTEAYDGAVLADQQKPFIVDVKDMWVSRHSKPGKTPSLKISFYDNMEKEFSTWACIEHTGFAQEKGLAMIQQLGSKEKTIDGAIKEWSSNQWKEVDKIQVRMDGKFPRILGYIFKPNQSQQQKLGEEE